MQFIIFSSVLLVLSIGLTPFLPFSDAILDESGIMCREGMVLVKRTFRNDLVCTSLSTAIRWNELGMSEIINYGLENPSQIPKSEKPLIEATFSSILKLPSTHIPVTIPMHQGYYNGELVYYIITDSSEQNHANIITQNQGWKVEFAPSLTNVPDASLSKTYMFTNGVKGNGIHGFQGEVFTSTPAQPEDYSALTSHIHVTWNSGTSPSILDSEDAILLAVVTNKVSLSELNVILNMPQIVWPEGQMTTKHNGRINYDTPFEGGQIVDIDKNGNTVTFVAHRGWGHDGKTIYYVLIDGTPSDYIEKLQLVNVPNDTNLIESSTIDIFQFTNGINSTAGMFGSQPPIFSSTPSDSNYSPMCRIFLVDWFDIEEAFVLASYQDFKTFKENGLINVTMSQNVDSEHIMNCPQINPFQ